MPEFFKQYRFKDTNNTVESWDQFLNIRIGARLIKDTGDEYQKINDAHVYDKVARNFLNSEDINGLYALLKGSNVFTDPQYCTAAPLEPYHIVNKEYVDALVASAAVDLSGFARLDKANIWEKPQGCNSEPALRYHLANKGYVDDRINEIEFDTTALAKLNNPNVFTAPQSVTVPATAPEHFVTKYYVDSTRDDILNNITGFIRADLPNTYTATQIFNASIQVPDPTVDREAASKLYVDTKVKETSAALGNFATLDLENVFEKDQTFKKYAICNSAPSMPYHLTNKEYVDERIQDAGSSANAALVDQENQWAASQDFSAGITAPPPVEDNDVTTKVYVDDAILKAAASPATTTDYGVVKLLEYDPDDIDSFEKSNAIPTGEVISRYTEKYKIDTSAMPSLNKDNTFNGNITANSYNGVSATLTTNSCVINAPASTFELPEVEDDVLQPGGALMSFKWDSDMVTPIVRKDYPDAHQLNVGDALWMTGVVGPYINVGGIRIGSIDTTDTSITAGITIPLHEYTDAGQIDAEGGPLSLGFRFTETEVYPACNVQVSEEHTTDALITAHWVNASPYIKHTVKEINISAGGFNDQKLAPDADLWQELRKHCVNGVARVSPGSVNTALKILGTKSSITSTMREQTIDISCADIIIKNINNCTFNLQSCKVAITECNCVINAVNSDLHIARAQGTVNAARRTHCFLVPKTSHDGLTINATVYSSVDNTDSKCTITTDDTSVKYK